MKTNSRYLKWFHRIEKTLWSFFMLFEDLCARCAKRTIEEVENGQRRCRHEWCCCMIDNQVHDNWESLNCVQLRNNPDWYESLRERKGPRMPGNGPCPALGEAGCLLAKHRPVTCTTQLCTKMLRVLNDLKILKCKTESALQIEDLIKLPDILPSLYGTGRTQKVNAEDVDAYIAEVNRLRERLAAIPKEKRKQQIAAIYR